jgi:hypothetical protein
MIIDCASPSPPAAFAELVAQLDLRRIPTFLHEDARRRFLAGDAVCLLAPPATTTDLQSSAPRHASCCSGASTKSRCWPPSWAAA